MHDGQSAITVYRRCLPIATSPRDSYFGSVQASGNQHFVWRCAPVDQLQESNPILVVVGGHTHVNLNPAVRGGKGATGAEALGF